MQVNCSQCTFSTEIDESLLPVGGMEGICPRCRISISLGSRVPSAVPEGVINPVFGAQAAALGGDKADYPDVDRGSVNLVNIIALLFVVDSTLSLIGRVPGIMNVLGSGPELSFHVRAKYLYDTLMATGFFISSFGLMLRKNWARVSSVCLLGLGLAEGGYMLIYQHTAIVDLERNLQGNFSEMKRNNTAHLVGCLIYLYFFIMLNTRRVKIKFH